MTTDQQEETEHLRRMAEAMDCLLEEDFRLLAGATQGTIEAWRKRGLGPAYVRLGKRVLYPREAVAEHLKSLARERNSSRVAFL